MMIAKKLLFRAFLLFYCVSLLLGCTNFEPNLVSTVVPTISPTSSPTPLLISSPIPLATLTPSSSTSSTPFTDPQQATVPLSDEHPVPRETLVPDIAKPLVLDLTQSDEECLLPCFWGIELGQTEWKAIEPLLATVAYSISYSTNGSDFFSDTPDDDSFIVWMYLYFPEIARAPLSYIFNVQDGIIMFIDAQMLLVTSNTPSAILETHEQPTEVWLLTSSAPMDDFLGFYLSFFYDNQHFLLTYSGQGTVVDAKVHGCVSEESRSLRLVAWSPEQELTFTEALDGLQASRQIIYNLPLDEATDMTVTSFYETFRNTKEPICLETATELWPEP